MPNYSPFPAFSSQERRRSTVGVPSTAIGRQQMGLPFSATPSTATASPNRQPSFLVHPPIMPMGMIPDRPGAGTTMTDQEAGSQIGWMSRMMNGGAARQFPPAPAGVSAIPMGRMSPTQGPASFPMPLTPAGGQPGAGSMVNLSQPAMPQQSGQMIPLSPAQQAERDQIDAQWNRMMAQPYQPPRPGQGMGLSGGYAQQPLPQVLGQNFATVDTGLIGRQRVALNPSQQRMVTAAGNMNGGNVPLPAALAGSPMSASGAPQIPVEPIRYAGGLENQGIPMTPFQGASYVDPANVPQGQEFRVGAAPGMGGLLRQREMEGLPPLMVRSNGDGSVTMVTRSGEGRKLTPEEYQANRDRERARIAEQQSFRNQNRARVAAGLAPQSREMIAQNQQRRQEQLDLAQQQQQATGPLASIIAAAGANPDVLHDPAVQSMLQRALGTNANSDAATGATRNFAGGATPIGRALNRIPEFDRMGRPHEDVIAAGNRLLDQAIQLRMTPEQIQSELVGAGFSPMEIESLKNYNSPMVTDEGLGLRKGLRTLFEGGAAFDQRQRRFAALQGLGAGR